ncbi:MAG: hypothetical protein AAF745_04500 [Planctomycetota bacterium]
MRLYRKPPRRNVLESFVRDTRWRRFARNPFGELTDCEREMLGVIDPVHLPSTPPARRSATQWLGPCGFGKTSHLRCIGRHLRHRFEWQVQYIYVTEEQTCDAIAVSDAWLIDEIDRMPRRLLQRLLSTGTPIWVGTHRDLSHVLRQFGYHVDTFPVQREQSADHLAEICNRRIAHVASMDHDDCPRVDSSMATAWLSAYRGNLRAIENDLYELIQQHAPIGKHVDGKV